MNHAGKLALLPLYLGIFVVAKLFPIIKRACFFAGNGCASKSSTREINFF